MLIDILVEALSLPVQTLIFICVATLIAAVVQGAAGIGYGLIAAPVFAFLAPQMVPGVILSTGLIITFLAVVREIKHVDLSLLTAGVVGRVPGSALGGFVRSPFGAPVVWHRLWFAIVVCGRDFPDGAAHTCQGRHRPGGGRGFWANGDDYFCWGAANGHRFAKSTRQGNARHNVGFSIRWRDNFDHCPVSF